MLAPTKQIREQMNIDFALLLLYPPMLSLLCILLADRAPPALRRVGFALSWVVLLGVAADAVENLTVLRMLDSGPSTSAALLAGCAGIIKWTLIIAAAAYAATAVAARLTLRQRRPSLA
jgi:hypothetical protein